jgi:thiol-disulfide isomerase/thioredoxin
MRRLLAVVAAASAFAIGACAPGSDIGLSGPGAVKVDVDSPELRAQKEAAGVEPCVQPETAKHDLGDGGLPDVTLPCLGGGPDVDLARLRGPMVITFWASWCGPCRRELPIFQRFAKKYAGSVAVLGIDTNDVNPGGALDLISDSGATFPLLADTETAVAHGGLRVTYLPTIAFLDADGELSTWGQADPPARIKAMEIESLAELEELAAEHLGEDALVPRTKKQKGAP